MRGALPPSFPPSHCVVFTAAAAAAAEEEEEGRPPVWSCVSHTHSRTEEGGGGHEKRGSALFPFPLVNGNKKTVSTSAIVYGDLSHTSQRMQRCMGVSRSANEEEQKWN